MSSEIGELVLGKVVEVHHRLIDQPSHHRVVEPLVPWTFRVRHYLCHEIGGAGRRGWRDGAGQEQDGRPVVDVIDRVSVSPDEGVLVLGDRGG